MRSVGSSLGTQVPPLGKWDPWGHLIEGIVSVPPYKGLLSSHKVYYQSQGLLSLMDPRSEGVKFSQGEGQSSTSGYKQTGDHEQSSKHLLLKRCLGWRSLTFHRLISKWLYKKVPQKSKVGTSVWLPNLKSLSKYLDSGCEQDYHSVKCIGNTAEKQRCFPQRFSYYTKS